MTIDWIANHRPIEDHLDSPPSGMLQVSFATITVVLLGLLTLFT